MTYRGDIRLGDTIDIKFSTVDSTGAPTTLAGSPAVAAYVGNSTTEITAGITLSVDFDSRTGLNNVRVVASGGNGFAAGTDVLAGGHRRHRKQCLGRGLRSRVVLDRETVGAHADDGRAYARRRVHRRGGPRLFEHPGLAELAQLLGIVRRGHGAVGYFLHARFARAAFSLADDIINGAFIYIYAGTGAGQSRVIDDFTGSTDTVSVSPNWTTTPDNTSGYIIFRTPPASTTSLPDVNVSKFGGTTVTGRRERPALAALDRPGRPASSSRTCRRSSARRSPRRPGRSPPPSASSSTCPRPLAR
jgi:hypothetical protein